MKQEKLRADLEALHAELKQADSLDDEQRRLLQTLADDIQTLLSRQTIQDEPYSGLARNLRDAVAQLEASHPSVTLLMRQVIDSLAYLGI